MSAQRPSASFSATLRVHLDDRPGAFADLARAIGDAGGNLGAIDLVRVEHGKKVVRDVTVGKKTAEDGAADVRDRATGEERRVPLAELGSVV